MHFCYMPLIFLFEGVLKFNKWDGMDIGSIVGQSYQLMADNEIIGNILFYLFIYFI